MRKSERRGTAHRAGAGGDDTGGAITSGVAGDPATHWAQAAAGATARGAAVAGDAGAGGLAAQGAAGVSHGVRVVCGFLHRGEFSDSDHFFNSSTFIHWALNT